MDDRLIFQSRIAAEPSDSGLHLVFADWLDDHGEARTAAFHRAVGRYLEICRQLPGRAAHFLPSGQTFSDAVYAEDDRFVVARNHHATTGPALLVTDLGSSSNKGLTARHRGLDFHDAISLRESDRLPEGVAWGALAGSEYRDTFGERAKMFAGTAELLEAMRTAFAPAHDDG